MQNWGVLVGVNNSAPPKKISGYTGWTPAPEPTQVSAVQNFC